MTTYSRERACQATIHEYPALKAYVSSSGGNFSLASLDRSFNTTHFNAPPPPARLKDICVPNSLKLEYYDTKLKLRASEQKQAFTFAHHCTLTLPANSPFSLLQASPKFSGTTDGPSSYETLASQACCPPGINTHEFLSFQALFSGKVRRWHQVLIELGSSNVNFGTEATAMLMGLLSSQIGPAENYDLLGVIHSVFKDKSFCKRLFNQINQRLDGVSANWREVYCMETLITLSLRLFELGELKSTDSFKLLSKARSITSNWISALRLEIQAATDAENSRRCSRYAFWAAILCRRTFIPQLMSKNPLRWCIAPVLYRMLHHYAGQSDHQPFTAPVCVEECLGPGSEDGLANERRAPIFSCCESEEPFIGNQFHMASCPRYQVNRVPKTQVSSSPR
jgi:hypothetical protein